MVNVQYWVDTTSGNPGESQRIASDLKSQDVIFLDCAVSGGPAGAIAGTLTAMIGGDKVAFSEVENIISSFANILSPRAKWSRSCCKSNK